MHDVTGLIGKTDLLREIISLSSVGRVIPMDGEYNLSLIPLTESVRNKLFAASSDKQVLDFNYLNESELSQLSNMSTHGTLMYFETDYFGGVGGQGAVVFKNGSCVFGPDWAETGAINRALTWLGVETDTDGQDGFDKIGLYKHRNTDRWMAS